MQLQAIEYDHLKVVDRFGDYIRFNRDEATKLLNLLQKELGVIRFTLPSSPPNCEKCKSVSLDEIGEASGIATLFKCRECEHEFYL